jgi:hypothetical protein
MRSEVKRMRITGGGVEPFVRNQGRFSANHHKWCRKAKRSYLDTEVGIAINIDVLIYSIVQMVPAY